MSDPVAHLYRARVLISGAAISLEHVLSQRDQVSREVTYDQQADWIIGELEHAIKQIREHRKL